MVYRNVVPGLFVARPNRFIALVDTEAGRETVHVKNTGRCRELLLPGSHVWLEKADKPDRKTGFDLISVYKGSRLVNIDSQAPNRVFGEWLRRQPGFTTAEIRPEYVFGDSRVDFFAALGSKSYLMEVKGVTLEREGIACFPDAPTLRGTKHLRNLIYAVEQGYTCQAVFVVQMEGMRCVIPNRETDPGFCQALCDAQSAGVALMGLTCSVTPSSLIITGKIPVDTSLAAWQAYSGGTQTHTV